MGYEGSSCQRASCPNDCSGHGTCEHVSTLAANDFDNMYDLWDAELTMGCACDPGYSGADCSSKDCKYGIDPLYVDDDSTARVEGVTYKFETAGAIDGTYALKFYDAFGEDYQTIPLKTDATCYTVEDALDGLPNTVIPDDSIVCSKVTETSPAATGYSLTFRGNPGYLKQLFVDTYLDGDRSTVWASGSSTSYETKIYNEGMTGEFTDYFATQCRNVYAEISSVQSPSATDFPELNSGYYLKLDTVETKLLKQCLGDSDGVDDDNVEVYDWDYGSIVVGGHLRMSSYPHAVKLVQVDPYDDYQGGMDYLTWWESVSRKFILANIPTLKTVGSSTTPYAVFVTDGIGELDGKNHWQDDELVTAMFEPYSNVLYTSYDTACETAFHAVEPCLDKGDMLFVIDSNYYAGEFHKGTVQRPDGVKLLSSTAPTYGSPATHESGNIYTIKKIYKEDPTEQTFDTEDRYRIVVDKNIPFSGKNTVAFTANLTDHPTVKRGIVNIFKFSPATTGNYDFVASCSNRGTCEEGTCECFKGYTNDNCDVQSSLAV